MLTLYLVFSNFADAVVKGRISPHEAELKSVRFFFDDSRLWIDRPDIVEMHKQLHTAEESRAFEGLLPILRQADQEGRVAWGWKGSDGERVVTELVRLLGPCTVRMLDAADVLGAIVRHVQANYPDVVVVIQPGRADGTS